MTVVTYGEYKLLAQKDFTSPVKQTLITNTKYM